MFDFLDRALGEHGLGGKIGLAQFAANTCDADPLAQAVNPFDQVFTKN